MADSFSFRKYNDGDFENYKKLYKNVYSKEIDEKFFRWKHAMSILINKRPIIYLVLNEKRKVIGANSFFATKLVYKGKEYLVVQSGDTMVLEEYRGKGLFKKIINFAMEDLKNSGCDAIFGFANSNSYPGFMKLGFESLYKINLFVKVLNYKAMLKGKLGDKPFIDIIGKTFDTAAKLFMHISGKFNIEKAELLRNEVINYIAEANKNYVHQNKNLEYLKWKYIDNPDNRYETIVIKYGSSICAVFVIRIDDISGRRSGKISECFAKDNKYINTYISLVCKYYSNKNLDYIEIWDVGNKKLERALKKNWFIKRKIELYFITKVLNDNLKFISDLGLWDILGGDSDTA